LTLLSFDLLAKAIGYLTLCGSDDASVTMNSLEIDPNGGIKPVQCNDFLNLVTQNMKERMERTEERFYLMPLRYFIADQVGKWKKRWLEGILNDLNGKTEDDNLILPSVFWPRSVNVVNDISQWVRWNAWQSNHFTWLQDTIKAGKVVHTSWGDTARWAKLGANDANSTYDLPGKMPKFYFSDKFGMRWEIVNSLLEAFGEDAELRVVEVGVFAGHFSKFLLEKFPKLQLIGIDPYIGTDETFPGDFSQTLDPSVAYTNAAEIYDQFPGRATLVATKSLQAAPAIPDDSIHAVFIDGCHFYECVEEDLRVWRPKVMKGGLVAGHDFSPQWPGVVRAVWENRPRKPVFLGMDWMYWWQEE